MLGKRVRDNGGVAQSFKKIRVRGTWFIGRGGGASEIDSAPTTRDPSISDQRSSSRECIVEASSRRKDHAPWAPLKDREGVVIGERARDYRKWTPLHFEACRTSGDHALRELLTQSGHSMIDAKGPGGFTPLMVAIVTDERNSTSLGHRRTVPVVRSDSSSSSEPSESNILLTQSYNGGGVYNGGIYQQHFTPVAAFIGQQANVNLSNDYGQTPLHLAAKQGREDYVCILLSAKADPNLQDIWGQSPVHVAIGASTDRAFKVNLIIRIPNVILKLII